jgi:subtilase family serine protease
MQLCKSLKLGVLLASALTAQYAVASPSAEKITAASPADVVEFHVYLPLRNQQQLDELLTQLHDSKSPQYQQWLTPAQFTQRFGPRAADLARVQASLEAHGFKVTASNAHRITAKGSASAVSATFSTAVSKHLDARGHTRFVAHQALQIPNELQSMNVRIVGLESVQHRHVHAHVAGLPVDAVIDNRTSVSGPYWFDDLKQAYDYPAYSSKTDGTGVSAAVLMADLIFPDDVAAIFDHELFSTITGKPNPSVTTVLIDGGGVYDGYGSFEASLDVQQILGGAPGANVTLVSIPDLSDAHIADGYQYIVDSNHYDIVNSSFGGCELEYTAAYNGGTDYTYLLQNLHEIFAQGNAQGITFVASSGDQGGPSCPTPDYGSPGASPVFVAGISSPSDDPDVTAVGGGNLVTVSAPPSLDSHYVRESAYGDPQAPYDIYGVGQDVSGGYWGAGGGVSSVFLKPAYQYLANTGSSHWRTNPDVGMEVGGLGFSFNGTFCDAISCSLDDSSVRTAYGVGLGGGFYRTIGTSVSSPEFVGALALFEQQLGKRHRLGNVNTFLYAAGAAQTLAGGVHAPAALQFYHRGIPGFDGTYASGYPSQNYDYIYGNGSPDVRKLFNLTRYPAAGLPQTPSNP